MAQKLYTAIVFMLDGLPPRKYRNINNIPNFVNYCTRINSEYINLYDKASKLFVERIYIKKGV
jgi:hypothetical protein